MRAQTSFLTRLPSPRTTGEENAWLSYFTTQRVFTSLRTQNQYHYRWCWRVGKPHVRRKSGTFRRQRNAFLLHLKLILTHFCSALLFLCAALLPYWPLVTSRDHRGVWEWPSAASGNHSRWSAHSGLHMGEKGKQMKTTTVIFVLCVGGGGGGG